MSTRGAVSRKQTNLHRLNYVKSAEWAQNEGSIPNESPL